MNTLTKSEIWARVEEDYKKFMAAKSMYFLLTNNWNNFLWRRKRHKTCFWLFISLSYRKQKIQRSSFVCNGHKLRPPLW